MSLRKHFPDLMSQCVRGKRFLQKVHFFVENAVPNDCVVGVARKIKYLHLGMAAQQPLGEEPPPHTGHHDICDEQVNLLRVVRGNPDGFLAVACFQDGVAALLQREAG